MIRLRITSDTHQWIVNEIHTAGDSAKNPGEETLRSRGFYPSLSTALRGASDMLLRDLCPPEGFDPAQGLIAVEALLTRAEKLVEVEA